jgi:two-component system, cell cycle sensor histidine kinase and response regulator CckA
MPTGGTLRIHSAVEEVEPGRTARQPNARPGPHMCLTVQDTGVGMDEATMRRLFEPFFTTKAPGKGTGLGLSTVYGIVRQHQGWVEIDSKLGSGTAFRIYLTLAEQPPAVEPSPVAAPDRPSRNQLILLVEDDPILRQLARLLLEDLGYSVLDAGSAAEALAIWQREQASIEVLVTDLVLPDATGFELARRLLQERPSLKIICTSGYTSESIRQEHPAEPGFRFVQKTYNKAALAEAIRDTQTPAPAKAAVGGR